MATDLDPEGQVQQAEVLETAVPARIADVLPDRLLILPLTQRPFFPAQAMPIVVDEKLWEATIERVGSTPHKLIGLSYARGLVDGVPDIEDIATTGTVARIHHAVRDQGRIQFIAEGLQRFQVQQWVRQAPPLLAQVAYPKAPDENANELRAYALAIINKIKELLPLNPLYKEQLKAYLDRFGPDQAAPLTDFAAALTSARGDDLQEILDTVPLLRRMEKTLVLVQHELEVAGLESEIRQRVEETISKHQREFFLREQLKEIQRQLGISKDDKTVEIEKFRARLDGLVIPEAAQERIDDEFDKLQMLESGSPEFAVTRNYLDTLTSLPWGRYSSDHFDLAESRAILERDHYGLDDVKQRIVEFLAVGSARGNTAGSILLLVGPPGVGKSSIGRSIADAMGREFFRFSVGGMRDEAEIKGHRRTYIGAMPGKLMQALRECGTANPVIMLDEVDKIGASYQGDPASALLEVLDPELNRDFLDHYLDVRFDLSKVVFICTANQLDTIPRPLLDRMEVIRLAGYITEEKMEIARRHLWPRVRANAGLKASQIRIQPTALKAIANDYAREAGVRNMEKLLNRVARKAVVELLEGAKPPLVVAPADLEHYLGPPNFRRQRAADAVGVVTGLAWTSLGGTTLNIESGLVHRKARGFKLTGQLGEVMRESAEIAYSYVTSHLGALGANPEFFDTAFVHVHVPEGAMPKDGPSAGITMATALLSLALDRKLRRPIVMTGELTLTGEVLPVGGIREKVIAGQRAGVKEVILPEANCSDYEMIPAYLRKGMKVHFVERFEQVAELCFGSTAKAKVRKKRK